MRLHLDESMPSAVAEGLRRRGYDVTVSSEAGLLAASDEKQLAYAAREDRILVTRDQDFLRLNAQRTDHAGIIFWTQRQRSLGQLIRAIDSLFVARTLAELRGQVVFL
ncbi:MAG: hypothetical protein DCC68_01995 [Planctomycetota bacterium]|nr:MAG: hypothetical protein DCC68_01995 [Planctomycetota bacterium]